MIRFFFLVALFSGLTSNLFSQTLYMYKTFGSVHFELDSTAVSPRQVLRIIQENPSAYKEFKQAKRKYNIAGVLGFAGGVMVGFPIGTAVVGGKANWALAAGGVAVIAASIPFSMSFRRHAENAIETYNAKLVTSRIRPSILISGNGVGLIVKF